MKIDLDWFCVWAGIGWMLGMEAVNNSWTWNDAVEPFLAWTLFAMGLMSRAQRSSK
jgi:hypothetical protein|tara:strand:+ start:267 stop:434 length:168 start_codon:yes stop_codon:yes gene_type:complete